MRITIKDIALATGLSTTTVSLVLNNKAENIPEKTRHHVLKTAEEMHYRPNQAAVNLARRTTNTLGLIIPDISNLFFSGLALGVEDTCRQHGWNVFLCNSNNRRAVEADSVRAMVNMDVGGIIYNMSTETSAKDAAQLCRFMEDYHVAYVMTDRTYQSIPCNTVRADHVQGGYLATKHLLELGHRRIACVMGPPLLEDSRQRREGYEKALAEYGVPVDETLLADGHYDLESGRRMVEALWQAGGGFTAVFAFNELSAIGAYRTLQQKGLRIPQDVSVVGYDDIYPTQITAIEMTSIRQPMHEIGQLATHMLLEAAEGAAPEGPRQICLPPELIVRSTTAPPRGAAAQPQ